VEVFGPGLFEGGLVGVVIGRALAYLCFVSNPWQAVGLVCRTMICGQKVHAPFAECVVDL
jgi:hypothetical protein